MRTRKLVSALALVVAVAVASVARPQTQSPAQFPDTPAAKQFAAWLAAFNSGDRETILHFFEKSMPERVAHIDDTLGFRKQTGGFDFVKAQDSTATRLTGLVQEKASGRMARFEIEVDAAEPHRILNLNLELVSQEAGPPPVRVSESEAISALKAELEKQTAGDTFSGAVLVAKNGKTIFSNAYRLADRANKIPNTLDTLFRLGSMNKMFTAVATLQLVQAGKIQLDAPLGKYITDYPNKEVASKVTIHQLLTHTGGTGDFFGPEFDAHRLELRTLQDYVNLLGKRGPGFEPGSKFEYSNFGFILLGVVIERVSGQSYYEYVQEHVFKPAGMTATNSLPEDQAVPNRSVGYMKPEGGGGWTPNTDTLPYRGTSAGGGYSTVGDLLRFAVGLTGHKLLNEHFTELLTTGKVAVGPVAKYAYGFDDRTVDGVRSFGHGGGAPGMNGELRIYPQSGYVIAVLANLDPPAATRISQFIGNRLPANP
jgi:D-alanyl-D-alanine carboxypeptidase